MNEKDRLLAALHAAISEEYDLGLIRPLRYLETTHQRRHKKIVVETEKGVFLAKTYTDDLVTVDSLYFQHNLSEYLLSNGLPVARIQRTRNQHSFIKLAGLAVELQQFLQGHQMPVTPKTLHISGMCLGKFHQVCQGRPAPPRDARKWRFSEVPREIFQNFYQRALQERNDRFMQENCDKIVSFLGEATQELAENKRNTFESGIIHGDWHGGNLLFTGEEIQGIIDLEYTGDGCYLEDLSYGISNLGIRTSTKEEILEFRCDTILNAYEQFRTLSWGENVALYYAAGIKHITTVAFQQPSPEGKIAGYTPAQWLEILVEQTRWLAEQARRSRWGS
ncbi:MAG: phosphotransferase [Candidatus Hydrogenedens sp.]|nr:phosphotransferase [Candidatus Hydrogenedens sp.]